MKYISKIYHKWYVQVQNREGRESQLFDYLSDAMIFKAKSMSKLGIVNTEGLDPYEKALLYLDYCPDTGIVTFRLPYFKNSRGSVAGSINKQGYLKVNFDSKSVRMHHVAWAKIYGVWPNDVGMVIDHINHDKLDNRIENLRLVTPKVNSRNTKKSSNNTSGYNGVSWCKIMKKWEVQAMLNGKRLNLGYYEDILDAAKARKEFDLSNGFHENHGEDL